MDCVIKPKRAFVETGHGRIEAIENPAIAVEGTRIASEAGAAKVIDLGRYSLLPGLIDIHVHGGGGVDVMDCAEESIKHLSLFKLREGVTRFCPTTVTTSLPKTRAALMAVDTARVAGAKIIGVFLEGPYIDPAFKGAHPEEFIRDISISELKELISTGPVKSVAIGPNLNSAPEAIDFLSSRGINVRLGHSGASLKQANAAIAAGANIFIHTYNAMSGFSHREPGMAGAALSNPGAYAEVICDLVHVHPEAVKILVKAKGPDKVVLITDCMMAGGLADGDYNLGELPVTVKDSIARTTGGTLAGSTLNLITAVKNAHETVGIPLAEAVRMASLTPAEAVGISLETGSIRPGKSADLIGIDDDYNVVFVMSEGEILLDNR